MRNFVVIPAIYNYVAYLQLGFCYNSLVFVILQNHPKVIRVNPCAPRSEYHAHTIVHAAQ